MENGPKSKKGEKLGQEIENGPRPEMGKKWPKNGEKIEKLCFPTASRAGCLGIELVCKTLSFALDLSHAVTQRHRSHS